MLLRAQCPKRGAALGTARQLFYLNAVLLKCRHSQTASILEDSFTAMRLLNTSDLSFSEFPGSRNVQYAILSHRWFGKELTHAELSSRQYMAKLDSYTKVQKFCSRCREAGFAWGWVDTVCIDKTSSAELQEAINSMWSWYRDAGLCLVYLADVSGVTENDVGLPEQFEQSRFTEASWTRRPWSLKLIESAYQKFSSSEWFTRGWTLQELLAPRHVVFCNAEWETIGSRSALEADLRTVTGISSMDRSYIEKESVAVKMSWAARRVTSRVEDRAYALLGLFNVNMPLLYGEGPKAFLRLQLHILQQSEDESIFAWSTKSLRMLAWGMLAPSPDAFEESSAVRCFGRPRARDLFQMTNKGLEIRLPILRSSGSAGFVSCINRSEEVYGEWARNPPLTFYEPSRDVCAYDVVHLGLNCESAHRVGKTTPGCPLVVTLTHDDEGWQRRGFETLRSAYAVNTPGQQELPGPVMYVKQPGLHTAWPSSLV